MGEKVAGLNEFVYAFYKNTKSQHLNSIVLIKIGDFYNTFDDDAQTCVDELDWIMTPVTIAGERVKFTGVPSFRVEHYVKLLIDKGFTVVLLNRVL